MRLALDDFGSGAASFSRPARAADRRAQDPRELHRARSDESDEDASIVGALVELGHALGLDVVAEGVETEAQLERLRELGCDAAQGDLIGPPAARGAGSRAAGRRGRVASTSRGGLTPAA